MRQPNYDDIANVDDQAQEGIMQEARKNLEAWTDKVQQLAACQWQACCCLF